MAQQTRKSVLAIKKEVTAGTPVLPAAGTDYVALQDGFEMTPNFESLENAELSPNVGSKAPILGLEAPQASVSHYIRHSGTEATAPSLSLLIEAALGEMVVAHGTERVTAAASTAGTSTAAAILKLAAGGTDFQRGKAVLIKDSTNGYSIRNVESVSTDDLTLGFNLAAAPAAGVATGKAILYKPADTLPGLTMSMYRGNGAAIEVMAGGKVSQMSIEANAGELLNGSFSFVGTEYFFNPIEITASTKYLDFTDDSGTYAVSVTASLYKDPNALAAALQTAMDAATTTTPTVTYSSSTGKFTIKTAGALLSLLWNTGTNAANSIGSKLGFTVAADDSGTGATTGYTSDNAMTLTAPHSATPDANVNPLVVKNNEFMLGSFSDYGCSGAQSFTLNIDNEQVDVLDICAASGIAEKLLASRTVTADVVLTLGRYDAGKFTSFRQGDTVRMCFNGGVKEGGNWIAGRNVNIYSSQMKISSFAVSDADGIVTVEMTLTAFVDSTGAAEIFVGLV